MMLQPTPPSQFDVHFQLLGVPVRVAPWFWLMALILGWPGMEGRPPTALASWIFVVFLSVLVHEMGHALTARAFGYYPFVLLYQLGGLAMYVPDRNRSHSRWQEMLIVAMGPTAGFLLAAVTGVVYFGLLQTKTEIAEGVELMLLQFLSVNIFWSILNLAPVYPLDGGRLCLEALMLVRPARGLQWTLIIGFVAGALLVVAAVMFSEPYLALMFGLLAFGNLQRWKEVRR
jgi:stage IV sporulation protein FB